MAAAHITGQLARVSPDDHRQVFRAFVADLPGDFDHYGPTANIDYVRDCVSYAMISGGGVELRNLRHFSALAETLNYRIAAERPTSLSPR